MVEIPTADTQMEDALFVLTAHVFLKTSDYLTYLDVLARHFWSDSLQYLLLFLMFVRAAHYWTETHPEISCEEDIDKLLATHEALAECILNDPEARDSISQTLLNELPAFIRADKAIGLCRQSWALVSRTVTNDATGRTSVPLKSTLINGRPMARAWPWCAENLLRIWY
jgi:hypothetical protein